MITRIKSGRKGLLIGTCGRYDFAGEGMAVVHYSRYCAVDTVHTHVVHCVVDPAVRPVVTEVTVDR